MKEKIAIVGGGTASLFLASFLNTNLFDVTIFEKKSTLGRKFLVAGDGGFNLTHSEDLARFKARYTPNTFLENALDHFSNSDLRNWLSEIGIPTFVGSSGRVFPKKNIKPIQVLNCILNHIEQKNISIENNKTFTGWTKEHALIFNNSEIYSPDYTVFALGGSSWKVTGSDGSWLPIFNQKGISTVPFKPSNCAYEIEWDAEFIAQNEGVPLKNIAISINNKVQKGEVVITQFGIEGNAIYALSPCIQNSLESNQAATIYIDFKPTWTIDKVLQKLTKSNINTSRILREKMNLSKTVIGILKAKLSKDSFLNHTILANAIKGLPIPIIGAAPLDDAISTSGGICLAAINDRFEFKKLKNQFCIGEMLNWDAPTGGYLIQACASSGVYLAYLLNTAYLNTSLATRNNLIELKLIDVEPWRFVLYETPNNDWIGDFSYAPKSYVDLSMLILLNEQEKNRAIQDRNFLVELSKKINDNHHIYLKRALDRSSFKFLDKSDVF